MTAEQPRILSTRLAVRTPDVADGLRRIVNELDGFTLQEDPTATRVDILVLEIGDDPAAELETIRSLLREGAVGQLFVTSPRATPEILLPALRTGAREFFQQPIVAAEVVDAFVQVRDSTGATAGEAADPARQGKICCVLGAKGGVGVTTFAVNLAASVQARDPEQPVALIDLNRLVGEVPLFLDLETDVSWDEIGKNINRLDFSYLKSALARHKSGMYVMPAPNWIDSASAPAPETLIQILKVMRTSFAAIVIDMGMYLDAGSLRILAMADVVYLLAILNLPCMINVKRIKESIRSYGQIDEDKIRVIANRYEKKSQITLDEAGRIIGCDIQATIPNNYGLTMAAINSGKPLAEVEKGSSLVKAYESLAATLVDKAEPKKRGWRLFG